TQLRITITYETCGLAGSDSQRDIYYGAELDAPIQMTSSKGVSSGSSSARQLASSGPGACWSSHFPWPVKRGRLRGSVRPHLFMRPLLGGFDDGKVSRIYVAKLFGASCRRRARGGPVHAVHCCPFTNLHPFRTWLQITRIGFGKLDNVEQPVVHGNKTDCV